MMPLTRALSLLLVLPLLAPTAGFAAAPAQERAAPDAAPAAEEGRLRAAYEEAFDRVVRERCDLAAPTLEQVQLASTDAELRGMARALANYCAAVREYELTGHTVLTEAPAARSGRFPFVAWSTFAGLALGIELDALVQPGSTQLRVGIPLVATGAAFTAALFATRGAGVTPGEASLTGTGVMFGTLNALLLSSVAELDGRGAALAAMAGTGLGGLAGYALAHGTRMSPGDASLVGSGGLWGSVSGLLLYFMVDAPADATEPILLATTNLGLLLAGGAALATEMSQDRVLLMDLGALLGGLAAGGVAIILADASGDPSTVFGATLGGVLAGGATALALTRGMDLPRATGADLGALLQVDDGQLTVGRPMPSVVPDLTRPGEAALTLRLAAGRL